MQRQEEKQKENDVLSRFNAAWEKPISQIIQDLFDYVPEAIHQFHQRIRKGIDSDLSTTDKILASQTEMTFIKTSVIETYQYYKDLKVQPDQGAEFKQYLLENMIERFSTLYNGPNYKESLHTNRLGPKRFYGVYFNLSAMDMWSFQTHVDYSYLSDHLLQARKNIILDSNPNLLYVTALEREICRYLIKEERLEIHFPPFRYNANGDNFVALSPLALYRQAICLGSEIALTGLARLYIKGSEGLERDRDFAIELYRLALKRSVVGGLPCDSEDPRILYYSTMASGMNTAGVDAFLELTDLTGASLMEAEWIMRMNYADPTLEHTLNKFEQLAIQNPNDIFDKLLDADFNSIKRLKLCLRPEVFELVLNRKKNQFYLSAKILGNKLPPELYQNIFSFVSASPECFETSDLQTALLKPPANVEMKTRNIRKLFVANLGMFKEQEQKFLENYRHHDVRVQQAYDEQFGLVVRVKRFR